MFEMPYGRAVASGGIGVREGGKSVQDHQGLIYGGAPGVAAAAYGRYNDNRGPNWPSTAAFDSYGSTLTAYDIQGVAKWEPTVKGTLTGFFDYTDQKSTDQGTFRQAPQSPILSNVNNTFADIVTQRQKRYEIAYYYRFNPQAAFLAYYSRLNYPYHLVNPSAAKQ